MMKKGYYVGMLLILALAFAQCSGGEKTENTESRQQQEESVSDAEFEKEMQKLDEDVEQIETSADSLQK